MNHVKEKLHNGIPVIGTWNTLNCPNVTRLISLSGLDFQIIDFEHGVFDFLQLSSHVQSALTANSSHSCLVRIPSCEQWMMLQALDQNSSGIVIPHFESPADLDILNKGLFYPPKGRRSFTPFSISADFGMQNSQNYASLKNQDTLSVVIIESLVGLESLPEILESSIGVIDVVYFGAYDLAGDMGYVGNPLHPEVVSRITSAIQLVKSSGVYVGGFVPKSPNEVQDLLEMGISFITYEVDANLFRSAYSAVASSFYSLISK